MKAAEMTKIADKCWIISMEQKLKDQTKRKENAEGISRLFLKKKKSHNVVKLQNKEKSAGQLKSEGILRLKIRDSEAHVKKN